MQNNELSKKHLKKIKADPVATAKAARLVYTHCTDEGIQRKVKGKGFVYTYRNKRISKTEQLQRINALVLPPAWTNVWISPLANGHLQATGIDKDGRKQYKYHSLWSKVRSQTKFYRLQELGKVIPAIRKQVKKDLSLPGLPKNKVLAAVIMLIERTGIRTGNEVYEKLYGSFGVTTLKDKHTTIKGEELKFTFTGKKGVKHEVALRDKKLAAIIRRCRDIPGQQLFQYLDENKKRQVIESGMVNDYLKEITGTDFTAKDLRTWCGTVTALKALQQDSFDNPTLAKKNIVAVLDIVAEQLGNTRTVCKKYYVHPVLLDMYEQGKLAGQLTKRQMKTSFKNGLKQEEKLLLQVLKRA